MLSINEVTKVFPNGKKANDSISLQIESDQIVGLVGPNGAGKTTLIRQILGLLKPTTGTILVEGNDLVRMKDNYFGYVPQTPLVFQSHTIRELIQYTLKLKKVMDNKKAHNILNQLYSIFNINKWENMYGYQLSGGQLKIVMLVIAICQMPSILILDEPSNMLDVVTKKKLWQFLKESKMTVFLTSHDIKEISVLCDYIYFLQEGKIVFKGNKQEIPQVNQLPVTLKIKVKEKIPEELLNNFIISDSRDGLITIFSKDINEILILIGSLRRYTFEYLSLIAPDFDNAIELIMEEFYE
ncbi:MAG TPA: ABC transporter ATP-binding protein [Ignavibacteria bacterium]|nr:ABC transporter ATP-binding protein [Ignavibacteria bacterium]